MALIDKLVKAFFEAIKTVTAGILGGALILATTDDFRRLTGNNLVILIIVILLILTIIFSYSNYIIEKAEENN